MAYNKSPNPFADYDYDEDFKPKTQGFDDDPTDGGLSDADTGQRCRQLEMMRTAQSAVDSSYRSLGLIHDSEKMGVQTAEELMRQGEALKRTNKMLDNMDQVLKTSQKHINSIKSVWASLVNYFKGTPGTKPPPEQPRAYQASEKLESALSGSKDVEDRYQASNPNLRKLYTGGFGAAASRDDGSSQQSGHPQSRHLREAHQILDHNLDDMSDGLRRLKKLGFGLQSELENQDNAIDSLHNKVDKMDSKILNTNKRIKNLK